MKRGAGGFKRKCARCALPLALSLLAASCTGSQSVLNPAGTNAGRVSQLFWLMFYVCAGVYVFVLVALWSRSPDASDAEKTYQTLP
jgi:hypothetical protein